MVGWGWSLTQFVLNHWLSWIVNRLVGLQFGQHLWVRQFHEHATTLTSWLTSDRISGSKWIYSARAAVMTMLGSFGGGFWSVMYSLIKNDGRVDILDLINGILASLVSVTAGCFLYRAWEAILFGFIGSVIVCFIIGRHRCWSFRWRSEAFGNDKRKNWAV